MSVNPRKSLVFSGLFSFGEISKQTLTIVSVDVIIKIERKIKGGQKDVNIEKDRNVRLSIRNR